MGYVPVFPEDNVVARVEGHGDAGDGPKQKLIDGGPPVATEVPADAPDSSPPTGAPETRDLADAEPSQAVTGPPAAAETDGSGALGEEADPAAADRAAAQKERRRQRQKRRKHGRNR
jgi:hypothetical protein